MYLNYKLVHVKALNSVIVPFIKQYKMPFILSILFLLLYLPLSTHINFYQNDDWYYYRQVNLFLSGKFKLLNDIAPTFYVQGLMGMLFSFILNVTKIPLLTLLVSTIDLFIFLLILKINKISNTSIFISFFIFISFPVFSYSVLGFMSENYFLFFSLFSLLFFNLFLLKNRSYTFYFSILFAVLSFFIKQNGLVLLLIYGLYFVLNRIFKKSAITFFLSIVIIFFYQYISPQTFEMRESKFSIQSFIPTNIIFYIYITLGYFGIMVLPLFSYLKLPSINFNKKFYMKLISCIVLLSIIYYLYAVYSVFKIYPYFGNTFAHLGYLYGSIDGEKPVAVGMSKLFLLFTTLGPYIITFIICVFVFNIKKIRKNKA